MPSPSVKQDQRRRRSVEWCDVLKKVKAFQEDDDAAFDLFCALRNFSKRWHRRGKSTDNAARIFTGVTGRGVITGSYPELVPVNGRHYSANCEPHGRRYYLKTDVIALLREQIRQDRQIDTQFARNCWICKRREKKWHVKSEEYRAPRKRTPSYRIVSTWNSEVTALYPRSLIRSRNWRHVAVLKFRVRTCGDVCYSEAERLLIDGWIRTQRLYALECAREAKLLNYIKKEQEWLRIAKQKQMEIRRWLKDRSHPEAQSSQPTASGQLTSSPL